MVSVEQYRKMIKATKKKRNQIEGKMQRDLGDMLRGIWAYRLNPNLIFWTYSGSGEKKDKTGAYWQYRKGLTKGDLDYRFHLAIDGVLAMVFLETKRPKGSLSREQKNFIKNHEGLSNAQCGVAKNMQEIEQFLIKTKVFIK